MQYITNLLHNHVFITAASAWALAQVIKTILDLILTKGFHPERLVGAGGMPSCHSATVCALALSCLYEHGAGSTYFAISAMLAIIVMYDARGVRRETGTQAVVINQIVEYLSNPNDPRYKDPEFSEEKLKELVGHTPLQVFFGAVVGIIVAVFVYSVIF